ncbi:MAG: LPS export ABC transporter periplasmic protein LptC [Gemmatimonadaceae bacterium]|nr:LPS export ABC transporter periplasmic protein LptC [Gemmatimonadaceae bacterium]
MHLSLRWAFATLAVITSLSACSRGPTSTNARTTQRTQLSDSAGQLGFGIKAPLTANGVTKGLLRADSGLVYNDGLRLSLRKNVTIAFVNAAGVTTATLTAPRAEYRLDSTLVVATGEVVVTSADGRILTTPHLLFDIRRSRLTSDSAYTLQASTAAAKVRGTGFVADAALARVRSKADYAKAEADSVQAAAKAAAQLAAAKAAALKLAEKEAARTAAKAARLAKSAPKAAVPPPATT